MTYLHLGRRYGYRGPLATLQLDGADDLEVPEDDAEGYLGALEFLRKAKPDMTIDRGCDALWHPNFYSTLDEYGYERIPDLRAMARYFVQQWKEGKGEFQRVRLNSGAGPSAPNL